MGNEASSDSIFVNSNCRILVVGPKSGDDCLAELSHLPQSAKIIATGCNIEELRRDGNPFTEANVLLNINGTAEVLDPIINELPFLVWMHSIMAGVDRVLCPALDNIPELVFTNAKGVFSSSLAEYTMSSCLYFNKSIVRLNHQKAEREWNPFTMGELRGTTMGIIGYGDIGRACAKLAKAFGMNVLALRRRPELSTGDSYADQVVGVDHLNRVMEQSDYLVVALALTKESRHFLRQEHFEHSKPGQILINVGRGLTIDENAMIEALANGKLSGAALDVFSVEPLPKDSPLWGMDNVLISPHNADMTKGFRHQSVRLFTENCRRFLSGEELLNRIDIQAGY